MGMFDYVIITCAECGNQIEEQSKAGQCFLNSYKLEDAPLSILEDMEYKSPIRCEKCGHYNYIKIKKEFTIE